MPDKNDYPNWPHILVVDDDKRICALVSRYLSAQNYMVLQAHNAAQAREMLHVFDVDALVVDVMMPGETGLSLTEYIRKETDLPVLLLTALGESDDRIKGLESGADDYLAKPFEPRELVLRLEAILRRTRKAGQRASVYRIGDKIFDVEAMALISALEADDDVQPLSAVEASLLQILATNQGEAVSRADLAEKAGIEAAERSIDVHITRLRKKIGEDPKVPRYLQTVRGKGYLLRAEQAG